MNELWSALVNWPLAQNVLVRTDLGFIFKRDSYFLRIKQYLFPPRQNVTLLNLHSLTKKNKFTLQIILFYDLWWWVTKQCKYVTTDHDKFIRMYTGIRSDPALSAWNATIKPLFSPSFLHTMISYSSHSLEKERKLWNWLELWLGSISAQFVLSSSYLLAFGR